MVLGSQDSHSLIAKGHGDDCGRRRRGGADSDYQVAGLFGYKLGKKCVLQAGWRYLPVDYRNSHGFVYDAATNGPLLGLTINFR